MGKVLAPLTNAEQTSMMLMVIQRILQPGSKLSLGSTLNDTVLLQNVSKKRFDVDELYRVMDQLEQNFDTVQKNLLQQRKTKPRLCLYDITSTYFEGTKADEGAYGHSRDKRWDRYQVVIGLVCDEDGFPLAIEVWPGNTADKSTVTDRIEVLQKRFGIEKAIFVGDAGMYSETNITELLNHGLDYILHTDWHTQRRQLEALAPQQLNLFDEQGLAEWVEDGVRYVGCASEAKRQRAALRRERGMALAQEKLLALAYSASRGKYYSWTRLREKVNRILQDHHVAGLWHTEISYLEEDPGSPEAKAKLHLSFYPDEHAIERRQKIEGKYILRTSVPESEASAADIDAHYRDLQQAERAFRHIKSFLKIRPVFHYRDHRVRAHVLICFFAYYLVKSMEIEFRSNNINEEVEIILRKWDQLRVVQYSLETDEDTVTNWQWSLGSVGKPIQEQIKKIGWWNSMERHLRSLDMFSQ